MSFSNPILPIGNYYNEFNFYPVHVFILFKCMCVLLAYSKSIELFFFFFNQEVGAPSIRHSKAGLGTPGWLSQ